MNDEIIIKKLSELINDGSSARKVKNSYPTDTYYTDLRAEKKFQISAKNAIKVRFLEDSTFYKDFMDTYKLEPYKGESNGNYHYRLMTLQMGVLEAVLDALKSGLTDDLFYQRELLVFSDLLTQAFEFLEQGLNHAAAIYGRIVLETTIREFAKEHGTNSESRFDQIIINLTQNGHIHKPFQNSLRSNYEIGSWAAHGNEKFNKLNENELREFLVFIRDKVLTLN